MKANQLRELISDTLKEFGCYSKEATELIMLTCAVESNLGHYIKQVKGPALGIFQMEPLTFEDNLNWYLKRDMQLNVDRLSKACNIENFTTESLIYNTKFAICLTRIHYLRKPGAIPQNVEGWAEYWKKHYNTYLGAGTVEKAIQKYNKYAI